MASLNELRRDLAVANRILARENVVDAYGHVSVRHPDASGRFLLSRSLSPEMVSATDIMEFGPDGETADKADTRGPYLERYIHAGVYASRPDVQAVVHNHSAAVVPFSVSTTPLRPVVHVAGSMGAVIPVWDIADRFGETNMLVVNMDQGRDMAKTLASNAVVLMRGHGCTVAAPTLKEAVITAIYVQLNAQMQLQALSLGGVKYLSETEAKLSGGNLRNPVVATRVWDYLASRANCDGI